MEKMYDELLVEEKIHNGKQQVYIDTRQPWISSGKISWPAIIAGVLVTIVTQLLLSLLGMGIGLGTMDLTQEQNPIAGLGTEAIIWWSASMLIALFLGGLTTGKMYQTKNKAYLTWHGLLTWCTFTVVSFLMLTSSLGKLVSGAGNVFGAVLTAGVSTNNELDLSGITREVRNLFTFNNQNNRSFKSETETGVGINNRESIAQKTGMEAENNQFLINEVQSFFRTENPPTAESREALINTLVSQTGMSRIEATNKVDQWIGSYETLKVEAKVRADEAAKTVSITSVIGFCALIIGALVTIWGARVAGVKEYVRLEQ